MVSMASYFSDKVLDSSHADFDNDELDLPDLSVDIEDKFFREDEKVWFWKNVESLLGRHNPVFWQCVKLRFVDDLKYDEIGEVLGCPSGTAKSRIHRAIQILGSDSDYAGEVTPPKELV